MAEYERVEGLNIQNIVCILVKIKPIRNTGKHA